MLLSALPCTHKEDAGQISFLIQPTLAEVHKASQYALLCVHHSDAHSQTDYIQKIKYIWMTASWQIEHLADSGRLTPPAKTCYCESCVVL